MRFVVCFFAAFLLLLLFSLLSLLRLLLLLCASEISNNSKNFYLEHSRASFSFFSSVKGTFRIPVVKRKRKEWKKAALLRRVLT
jgi:hypothetical protein